MVMLTPSACRSITALAVRWASRARSEALLVVYCLSLSLSTRQRASGRSTSRSGAGHPYPATVPALAIQQTFDRQKGTLTTQDLKVLEIIEAFASVAITSSPMLEVEPDRVNPNCGSIAIGHPISAFGRRILGGLTLELRRRVGGIGEVTIWRSRTNGSEMGPTGRPGRDSNKGTPWRRHARSSRVKS